MQVNLNLKDAEVFYYPNYFTTNESMSLFQILTTETLWQQDDIKVFGKTYKQPRLTSLYGSNKRPYSYSNITMYPNPATSVVVLQASQEIASIQVLNLLGQRVSSITVNDTTSTINISGLKAGSYIVNVLFSNGNTQNLKFIKK